MKSVREKSNEEHSPNGKYEKLKFKYLEISLRTYMMSGKDSDIEKMKKEGRENIDNHIKNSKKMTYDEVVLLCEDVKKSKNDTKSGENLWSKWAKFAEKADFVYSEYDRLINSLKEEIEKKKPSE